MTQLSLNYGLWTVVDNTPRAGRVLCACSCGRTTRMVSVADLRRGRSKRCQACGYEALTRGPQDWRAAARAKRYRHTLARAYDLVLADFPDDAVCNALRQRRDELERSSAQLRLRAA